MGEQRGKLEIGDQRANYWSAFRLLCTCGYRVRCQVICCGESLGELVFIDDKEASMTWDERIWHCPGCRTRLGLLGLRS